TVAGQAVPVVRVYLSIPAGVLGLAPVHFVAANLLGSLIWNAPLLTLGYVLRESGADAASIGLWLVASLAALEIVALCAWRFRCGPQDRSRRIEAALDTGRLVGSGD